MATKAKQGPTVRISETYKAELETLANSMGISQTEVLHKAIDSLKREQFFNQMKEDYEAIATDKRASKSLSQENELFDSASDDGID